MITSSPGSMNPMKALNMPYIVSKISDPMDQITVPSFAPVVIETSVSGLMALPKNGE